MPERFYGGASDRYPGQAATICEWLRLRKGKGGCIKCLDAACGDGAAAYGLARLLLAEGWHPHRFEIEGWTLDPLEVWAASHGIFPQSPLREATFRAWVAPVFEQAANRSMLFKVADLNNVPQGNVVNRSDRFDLIVCNGLLGGPIIDRLDNIRRIMSYFNGMLAPGGMLMVADHFHGGWKKNIPGEFFGDVLEAHGLSLVDTAEGVAALKSD